MKVGPRSTARGSLALAETALWLAGSTTREPGVFTAAATMLATVVHGSSEVCDACAVGADGRGRGGGLRRADGVRRRARVVDHGSADSTGARTSMGPSGLRADEVLRDLGRPGDLELMVFACFRQPSWAMLAGMTAVEEIVEDLADLYVAEKTARGSVRIHIQRVQARRARAASRGVPKAPAARMLGISVNTLDKWIGRGRIRTIQSPSGRALVDAQQVAQLLIGVRVLRQLGRREGLLAAAIQQLEREDPRYQREFAELYGQSLESMETGNVKPLKLPGTFGPED